MLKLLVVLALCVASVHGQPNFRVASVYYSGQGSADIHLGKIDDRATAWGRVEDTRMTVGWDKLDVRTASSGATEEAQMYAAGYFEGYMLQEGIWAVYNNFLYRMLHDQPPAEQLVKYYKDQLAWSRKMIAASKDKDPYWKQVGVLMSQFDGMVAGYQAAAPSSQPMKELDFWLFQSSGDLYDLIPALVPHARLNWTTMDAETFAREHEFRMSCSAIIRLTDKAADLLASHNTWTDYASMVRAYKVIHTGLQVPGAKGMAFSSKPALLYSKDDFYVLSSGLVVMETTNGVLDESIYSYVTPQSLLTWQRVPVCHRMSKTAPEWVHCMDKYSSGTYGNQWMVIDYKLFKPGQPLQKNTVWIIEQVPGYSDSSDVSQRINDQGGYWPSYNVPFSEKIYNVSGYYEAWKTKGDEYSYSKCPRAQMFARDFSKVNSVADLKKLMQYNDYKNDPISKGSPKNSIASRYDLLTTGATAFGTIDAKITSSDYVKRLRAHAISGPTKDQQVPWTWTDAYKNVTHMGEPETYNFEWQDYGVYPL